MYIEPSLADLAFGLPLAYSLAYAVGLEAKSPQGVGMVEVITDHRGWWGG